MSMSLWIRAQAGDRDLGGACVTDLTSVAQAVYRLLSEGTIRATREFQDPQEPTNGDQYVGLTAADVERLLREAQLRHVVAHAAWTLLFSLSETPDVTWTAWLS